MDDLYKRLVGETCCRQTISSSLPIFEQPETQHNMLVGNGKIVVVRLPLPMLFTFLYIRRR